MTTAVEAELAELLPARTWRSKSVGMVCPEFMLAFIQRKLDEARADSELLEKVETLLRTDYGGLFGWYADDGAVTLVRSDYGDKFVAPTLREALRKLVEEKP